MPGPESALDRDAFWEVIALSRQRVATLEEQARRLSDLLERLGPEEIIDFNRELHACLSDAYRWDIWAVAAIVAGLVQEQDFQSFRAWLVSLGRRQFEAVLEAPDTIADLAETLGVGDGESIIQAAPEAFEVVTGREMPHGMLDEPLDPEGLAWEEEDLPGLYPDLWERFREGREEQW